jgi:hypothetical protein
MVGDGSKRLGSAGLPRIVCSAGLVQKICNTGGKILGVMQAQPEGSMDDWVKLAYDDVDPRIWPVAKRSLLAHVERIQAQGLFNL